MFVLRETLKSYENEEKPTDHVVLYSAREQQLRIRIPVGIRLNLIRSTSQCPFCCVKVSVYNNNIFNNSAGKNVVVNNKDNRVFVSELSV